MCRAIGLYAGMEAAILLLTATEYNRGARALSQANELMLTAGRLSFS